MPQPQFIGPTMTEAFSNRGARNIRAPQREVMERENAPGRGLADEGAVTERLSRFQRRLAEIERIQSAYEARRQSGRRVRKPSAKIENEAQTLRERIADLERGRAKLGTKKAQEARTKAARKGKAAAKKQGNNQAADKIAGATKKRAPRTEAQKAARNQREREARAAKRAAGA